jgi:RNase adaptor protein for sRNA GlmZ degradation
MKILVPEDVLVQDLGGEMVLLNLESEQYFGLDDVGTSMWTALSNSISVEAAYEKLKAEYDVAPKELERDLHELITQLAEHGLLKIIEA